MEWEVATTDGERETAMEFLALSRNSIVIQGKLVRARLRRPELKRKKPSKRKAITEFSKGSRRRLLKWIATVDWPKLPRGMFITLTYPDDCAKVDMKTATNQRNAFIQKMERHLGEDLPLIWRKEFNPRKSGRYRRVYVQHFHLCVFTHSPLSIATICQWWRDCIGWKWEIQCHRKYMDGQQAAFYMAKYLTKDDEAPGILEDVTYLNKPGRAWGYRRKELVPHCPMEFVSNLTEAQYESIMAETLWMCPPACEYGMDAYTLLGKKAEEAETVIRDILS